jgi:23S rRNA (uracil1939-C5)-methyltransferase
VHRVVMVSCDPATLARDGRQLISAGFQLASLDAYDMFSQTLHVESVAVFER